MALIRKSKIQFYIRLVLSALLIVSIWERVDWTVGLFALLVAVETEIRYLKLSKP